MAPNPPKDVLTKPLLRGVSHELAAYVSAPLVLVLVLSAQGRTASVGALVYGLSLWLLFSISALYHRPVWSVRARQILWRLDHSAIFLLIAGTYTPLGLLLGPGTGHAVLATIWSGAAIGVVLSVVWVRAPKQLMAALYVLLGWVILPALPKLRAAIGDGSFLLLLLGGAFYTAGAVIYARRRPDPFPQVFGFHEVFHVLVIAAAACHFVVVRAALLALAAPPP